MTNINIHTFVKQILAYPYCQLDKSIKLEADRLVKNALSNRNTPSLKAPTYFHIAGIPGSGKSTYIQEGAKKQLFGREYVVVNFDSIMLLLKGYNTDLSALGSPTKKSTLADLFAKWEMPARIIGYEILQKAIDKKLNIVFENSGVFEGHILLMKELKKCGYNTEFHSMECPLETAIKRAKNREQLENRHTPKALIQERFRLYEKIKSAYKNTADKTVIHKTTR